jgi:hypothetical protein
MALSSKVHSEPLVWPTRALIDVEATQLFFGLEPGAHDVTPPASRSVVNEDTPFPIPLDDTKRKYILVVKHLGGSSRALGQIFVRTGNGRIRDCALIVIDLALGAIPVVLVAAVRLPFLKPDLVRALGKCASRGHCRLPWAFPAWAE